MDDTARLVDVFRDLSSELKAGLDDAGRHALASQVDGLVITAACECDDSFCTSFYTGPRPDDAWSPGHENVVLEVRAGMVVLDVVDEVIRHVEVLDRGRMRPSFQDLRDRLERQW